MALPLLILLGLPVLARDAGQWNAIDPATRAWFRGLTNQNGFVCCYEADGLPIDDPDWKIDGDGYAVNLGNGFVHVDPDLIVTSKNRIGRAVVWLWPPVQPEIRCFMPGAAG